MSKFNAGDRVVVTKSNLPEYVGLKATVIDSHTFMPEVVNIKFDSPPSDNSWVHTALGGSMPWMEEWLIVE